MKVQKVKVRVASAGTGKTTNLVVRYLQLISSGVPLRRIAGVTFTHLAAGELRQRTGAAIKTLLAEGDYLGLHQLKDDDRPRFTEAARELGGATLTTIHGFMGRLLRLNAPLLGLDPEFKVLGEWEARALFEEELQSTLFLARVPAQPLFAALQELGSDAEEQLLAVFLKRSLHERFSAAPEDAAAAALLTFYEAVFRNYSQRLGSTLLAPPEIERRALTLVTAAPAALARVAQRYQHVLVDEFQDVNPLQGAFFSGLQHGAGLSLEVVGDPKQSIYGFRDADVNVFRRALAAGEQLPPLVHSRRHAPALTRFLNHVTSELGARNQGFSLSEAPEVTSAGEQADARGSVEVLWTTGAGRVEQLRISEAAVLAAKLQHFHEQDAIPYAAMAVLARTNAALNVLERELAAAGVPAVIARGRGYYSRPEVRDVLNALEAGINPSGTAFTAWLRSPFAQLPLDTVQQVLAAADPAAELARVDPVADGTLQRIRELTRTAPLAALQGLLREPLIAGRRFVDFLTARQRANVDALLFQVAARPPGDLELLLRQLERLANPELAEVPQAADGVQLLTIHSAKGLEWRVVAVFDLGYDRSFRPSAVNVDVGTGELSLPGSAAHQAASRRLKEREEQEAFRQFYVAISRPRDHLLLSGSVPGGERGLYAGWAGLLRDLGFGAAVKEPPVGVLISVHAAPEGARRSAEPLQGVPALAEATWSRSRFTAGPFPPVHSPSGLRAALPVAALPAAPNETETTLRGALHEAGRLPGSATAIGTLVHQGVAFEWDPAAPGQVDNLLAQEVMFPFTSAERQEIVQEVLALLHAYRALLGEQLAPLAERLADHAELPFAFQAGTTIWQGTIDRLYRTQHGWFLDDYKTDRTVDPAVHDAQLGLYLEAVQEIWSLQPQVRLVYLRQGRVEPRDSALLLAAAAEAVDTAGQAVSGTALHSAGDGVH